jgi:ElaB/YqjD/DUF883 family membrane-anchored ribosome-binding protein
MSITGNRGADRGADGDETQASRRGSRKAKLEEASHALRRQARRYADEAQQRAEVAQERTLETLRERPMTVVSSAGGIALLAGLVLGFYVGQAFAARR